MPWDGLDERALERLTGAPLVRVHDTLPSTLDLAHELGAAGAPDGSLVIATQQTAGRGRLGRAWQSPPGGLWIALLARPAQTPEGGAYAVRAGLAVREAVAAVAPAAAPRLKWPNDIMVADRKAGGVLCEARWTGGALSWIAAGVGLNVRGPVAPVVAARAIALQDIVPDVTRPALLAALAPRLAALSGLPARLDATEQRAFLAACWRGDGMDEPVALDPDGGLVVRLADGSLDRRRAPS